MMGRPAVTHTMGFPDTMPDDVRKKLAEMLKQAGGWSVLEKPENVTVADLFGMPEPPEFLPGSVSQYRLPGGKAAAAMYIPDQCCCSLILIYPGKQAPDKPIQAHTAEYSRRLLSAIDY